MVPLQGPTREWMAFELADGLFDFCKGNPQTPGALVKPLRCYRINVRIRHERKVVGEVRPLPIKACSLGGKGNAIGQGNRITISP
jgi:hypothetical protein